MRRFSQRHSLVTLSDINITPLLDLAFVLLIIFVITTPLLEQGLSLKLPAGGREDQKRLDPRDIRTVDINTLGQFKLRNQWMTPEQIATELKREQLRNPNLIVYIRADQNGPYKFVAALLNRLEQTGVVNVSLRTDPTSR
ncbi:MAG TPA: biopolymer transporter ExbD [Candidatus Dormibacteraeota bacterium]|jgi:biopolymer transport protein ExbD|nr:biopolymer transporter ExbD [Verrucomicrobiae bacterium]HXJ76297.1 biopolymer transporter ExbD [Candidatus Dormibacteraeota bacterium]